MSKAEILAALPKLSAQERSEILDELWRLEEVTDTAVSPAWHGDVLRERDRLIAEGKEPSTDWVDAKRRLRERCQ